jgi:hypothetical protein
LINLGRRIGLISDVTEEGMNIINIAVLIFGATLLLGFVACGSNDGEQIIYKTDSVYYLSPVTADEAQRFLDWSVENEVIDGEEPSTNVQLRKVAKTYEIRASLREGISLVVAEPYMSQLACLLQDNVFGGSDVEVLIIEEGNWDKIIRRNLCLN